MRALCWLLLLAACTPAKDPSDEPAPQWKRQQAAAPGVSFETLVARPPARSAEKDTQVLLNVAGSVWSAVYVGKGLTLASFNVGRAAPGKLTAGRHTICGESVVTEIESRQGISVEVHDPENHWVTSPDTTTVTAAFTHAGVGVVAQWTVDDVDRARLRDAEERFFASFRCE